MGYVTIDMALMLEIAGSIGVFGAAAVYVVKAIKRVLKPMTDLKEKVEKHAQYLDNDNKRLKKLEELIGDVTDAQKLLLKTHLAVLEHLETDNATGKLNQSRKDITDFLVDK